LTAQQQVIKLEGDLKRIKSKIDEEAALRQDLDIEKQKVEAAVKAANEKLSSAAAELEEEKKAHSALKKKVAILLKGE